MKSQPVKRHWLDSVDHWSTPVMANFLWVLLSIPLVTMPLAAVGLLGVIFRWADGHNPQVFTVFVGTIRRTWLRCYLIVAADLLIGGLVFLNLLIFQLMDMGDIMAFLSRGVTLFVAIMLVLVNIYALSLVSVWDAPLKQIIKFSIQLVFAQPLWTLATGFGIAAVLVFSTIFPAGALVFVTGAVLAYIACRGTWFVVRKYIPRHEFTFIEVD